MGIFEKLQVRNQVNEYIQLAIRAECSSSLWTQTQHSNTSIHDLILAETFKKANAIIEKINQSGKIAQKEFRDASLQRLSGLKMADGWPELVRLAPEYGLRMSTTCPKEVSRAKFYGVSILLFEKWVRETIKDQG